MERKEQVEVESAPKQLDEYPSGPCDLSKLTMYHVRVASRMSDEVITLYTFYLLCCVVFLI